MKEHEILVRTAKHSKCIGKLVPHTGKLPKFKFERDTPIQPYLLKIDKFDKSQVR